MWARIIVRHSSLKGGASACTSRPRARVVVIRPAPRASSEDAPSRCGKRQPTRRTWMPCVRSKFSAPLAPHLAARFEGAELDADRMRSGVEYWLRTERRSPIVEGAGGLFSPLGDDELNIQLACDFGWPIVIVAANRLARSMEYWRPWLRPRALPLPTDRRRRTQRRDPRRRPRPEPRDERLGNSQHLARVPVARSPPRPDGVGSESVRGVTAV